MTIPIMVATVLAATLLASPVAWAGPPTDQVRIYTDAVIRVLEDPALKAGARRGERREAVRRLAVDVFDVSETARRALGIHWQGRTAAEREEFSLLFADLLERTYINRIDYFGGERLRFVGESIDGDIAVVRARVVTRRGTEVPVDARLIRHGERWLIYDIAVQNISLIANYRAQFDRIIRSSSFEDLVKRLRAKQTESLDEPPRKGT